MDIRDNPAGIFTAPYMVEKHGRTRNKMTEKIACPPGSVTCDRASAMQFRRVNSSQTNRYIDVLAKPDIGANHNRVTVDNTQNAGADRACQKFFNTSGTSTISTGTRDTDADHAKVKRGDTDPKHFTRSL